MAAQVQGMASADITQSDTVNGMLYLPERIDTLDKVLLGDAAILIISP